MDGMARYPGLMQPKTRWYLRAKVPHDLIAFLGREEIWRSLQTGDHRLAVRRYTSARADLQRWFDLQRERKAAGERLNGEAPRMAARWLARADREAALADFGLMAEARDLALAEAGAELVELIEGEAGAEVASAVDRVLIAAGWPARPHRVGAITTRTKTADARAEAVEALQGAAVGRWWNLWPGGAWTASRAGQRPPTTRCSMAPRPRPRRRPGGLRRPATRIGA
jgi:hypothetical protein